MDKQLPEVTQLPYRNQASARRFLIVVAFTCPRCVDKVLFIFRLPSLKENAVRWAVCRIVNSYHQVISWHSCSFPQDPSEIRFAIRQIKKNKKMNTLRKKTLLPVWKWRSAEITCLPFRFWIGLGQGSQLQGISTGPGPGSGPGPSMLSMIGPWRFQSLSHWCFDNFTVSYWSIIWRHQAISFFLHLQYLKDGPLYNLATIDVVVFPTSPKGKCQRASVAPEMIQILWQKSSQRNGFNVHFVWWRSAFLHGCIINLRYSPRKTCHWIPEMIRS